MLAIIYRGFIESKAGKFYLIVFAAMLIINITTGFYAVSLANYNMLQLVLLVIFIYATIKYSITINIPIWLMVVLVLLIFIPIGGWINFFILASKTFTYNKENNKEISV